MAQALDLNPYVPAPYIRTAAVRRFTDCMEAIRLAISRHSLPSPEAQALADFYPNLAKELEPWAAGGLNLNAQRLGSRIAAAWAKTRSGSQAFRQIADCNGDELLRVVCRSLIIDLAEPISPDYRHELLAEISKIFPQILAAGSRPQ